MTHLHVGDVQSEGKSPVDGEPLGSGNGHSTSVTVAANRNHVLFMIHTVPLIHTRIGELYTLQACCLI